MKRSIVLSSTASGRDPAQARPSGETRKAMTDPLVGRRKKLGPDLIEVEVGGLEHRPQARGFDGGGKVAAQVGPALARDLGPGRHHAVEGPADVGKVERDRRRWLAPELGEAGDRRAQVALAAVREAAIGGKPIEDGLQRRRDGGLGEGWSVFIGATSGDSWGPSRTRTDSR